MAVGEKAASFPTTVFSGSDGWLARVGHSVPSSVGDTANPFGAGAAACLAAANIFRALFVSGSGDLLDENAAFSTWSGERSDGNDGPPLPEQVQLPSDAVLVGLGAVGHGVLWALGRSPLAGRLQLVDPETVELSNLQRYVLGQRSDDRHPKTEIAKSALATTGLEPVSHPSTWAEFVARDGYDWPLVLVGLDSARDRRAVQAALPGWVANAWTQPGDLGVSVRSRFGGEGACVSCLYLPSGPAPNEDELVAKALGVPNRQQQIRDLLHHGSPVPADLLEAISTGLDVPIQALRGSRDMASESCTSRGSAVAPLLDWSGWDARSKRSMYRSPTSPRLQECFSRAAGPSCTWRRPRTDPDHPDRRPSAPELTPHPTSKGKRRPLYMPGP
jgi:Prokaryotic E2 family C/ThiF family